MSQPLGYAIRYTTDGSVPKSHRGVCGTGLTGDAGVCRRGVLGRQAGAAGA
jgi:hypothetical protein